MNGAIKYVHTLVKTKTDQKKKKNSVQHQCEQKSFPCKLINANFNIEKIQLSGKSKPELHWFCFTSISDRSKNSPPSLNQSDAKLKPLVLDQLIIP